MKNTRFWKTNHSPTIHGTVPESFRKVPEGSWNVLESSGKFWKVLEGSGTVWKGLEGNARSAAASESKPD